MHNRLLSYLTFAALLTASLPAAAQPHFQNCLTRTSGSATILIPVDAAPAVEGAPLEAGDEIAVFTAEGDCAGSLVWAGQNAALAVWSDDSFVEGKKGFAANEPLLFRLWDASTETEHSSSTNRIEIRFSDSEPYYRVVNTYKDNAIFLVRSLKVSAIEQGSSILVPVEENERPDDFSLSNYPNPFSPATTVRYSLAEAGDTTLEVYDIQGRLVERLSSGFQVAGRHEARLDAGLLAPGMYLCRLTSGSRSLIHRMTLAR